MPGDWQSPPQPTAVLFGSQLGWSPEREAQPLTRACKTCGGRIADGSRCYCAGCTRTGFEAQLAALRKLAPPPRIKEEQGPAKVEVRLTKKEIRDLRKSPEGREWLAQRAIVSDAEDVA